MNKSLNGSSFVSSGTGISFCGVVDIGPSAVAMAGIWRAVIKRLDNPPKATKKENED